MSTRSSINLSDPRVRELLGESPTRISSGNAGRQVVQLAGDAPDPTGLSSAVGLQSTHRLTGGKQEVAVLYGDIILTVDVYALPGEPMKAHIICPRCMKHSTIPGDRKHIEYDARALNPMQTQILLRVDRVSLPEVSRIVEFGRLSIEAFECSWEIGDGQHTAGGVHTGASLCRLRLVIDDNRARDA